MITGKVISGLGRGKTYIMQYQKELFEAVGFECFPGTLNVKLFDVICFDVTHMKSVHPVGKGRVDCFPVLINGAVKGSILRPHQTRHSKDIIEIVASHDLRLTFGLKDGDEITCELE